MAGTTWIRCWQERQVFVGKLVVMRWLHPQLHVGVGVKDPAGRRNKGRGSSGWKSRGERRGADWMGYDAGQRRRHGRLGK